MLESDRQDLCKVLQACSDYFALKTGFPYQRGFVYPSSLLFQVRAASAGQHSSLLRSTSHAGGGAGDSNLLYIQMEFCPRTLQHELESGGLQEEDAWQLLRGVLAGARRDVEKSLTCRVDCDGGGGSGVGDSSGRAEGVQKIRIRRHAPLVHGLKI